MKEEGKDGWGPKQQEGIGWGQEQRGPEETEEQPIEEDQQAGDEPKQGEVSKEGVEEMKEGGEEAAATKLPPWFHPPLLLPAAPCKEELLERTETESVASSALLDPARGGGEGDGVTPPLLSPSFRGLGSPLEPPQGLLDPRHIIHFLTRKVCQLF